MGEAISDASPAEDFHELRKKGKELRYLLELFGVQLFDADVVGPLIDSLKDLQELLGRHQDREVQVAMVRSLTGEVAPRPGGGPACLAMGTLVARLRDDELAARRAFAESFAELASADRRDAVNGHLRLSGPVAADATIRGWDTSFSGSSSGRAASCTCATATRAPPSRRRSPASARWSSRARCWPVARRSSKTSSDGLPARLRGGRTGRDWLSDPAKPPGAATGTRSAGCSEFASMSDLRTAHSPIVIDRVERSRGDGDAVRLRLGGRRLAAAAEPELDALLVVQLHGHRHRFAAVEDRRRDPSPGSWRASFTVPDWAVPVEYGQASLWVGEASVPVPPVGTRIRMPEPALTAPVRPSEPRRSVGRTASMRPLGRAAAAEAEAGRARTARRRAAP